MTYLAKSGKIAGPFTPAQIESMRESGALAVYSWRWSREAARWEPIDPPPPAAPTASAAAEAQASPAATDLPEPSPRPAFAAAATAAVPVPRRRLRPLGRRFEAICHDFREIVSGTVERGDGSGYELRCEWDRAPVFSPGSPLQLSLLDPETGRTENLPARLEGLARRDGWWVYTLSTD